MNLPKRTQITDAAGGKVPRAARAGLNAEERSTRSSQSSLLRHRPTIVALSVCTVVCIVLIFCRWYAGVLPQMMFGHDSPVLLDGGWKWKWGIVPHRDYYSPLGALNYALVAWCMDLGSGIATALPNAVCLVAFFLLPMALYATFTRMKPVLASLATVMIIAQALTPHTLRLPAGDWSYACVYNRWCYALFSIALILVTTPPLLLSRRKDISDGCFVVICVAASIMIKISYGLLLGAVVVAYAVIQHRRLPYYIAALAAAILSIIAGGVLIDWSFANMFHDIRIAAHARAHLGLADFFASALYLYPELCTSLILAGLCAFSRSWPSTDRKSSSTWRTFVFYAFVAGCSAVSIASNSPSGEYREGPLLNICVILLFAAIYQSHASNHAVPALSQRRTSFLIAGIFLILSFILLIAIPAAKPNALRLIFHYTTDSWLALEALVCLLGWILLLVVRQKKIITIAFGAILLVITAAPTFGRDIASIVAGVNWTAQKRTLPANQVFDFGGLKGVQIKDFGGDPFLPTTYVGKVKDGLDLLRQQGEITNAVAVLDFSNPFDLVREIKPPKGTPTCWQLGFVFSQEASPSADQVFGNVDAILIPKQFGDGNQQNVATLFQIYGAYLDAHFTIAAQSPCWVLAKRKTK